MFHGILLARLVARDRRERMPARSAGNHDLIVLSLAHVRNRWFAFVIAAETASG
jgi:hypothetical protein